MPDNDFPMQDPLFRLAEELRASRERLTGRPADEVGVTTPYVEIPPLADPAPEPIASTPAVPVAEVPPAASEEDDPFVILAGGFDGPFVAGIPEIPDLTELVVEAPVVETAPAEHIAPAAKPTMAFEETTAPIRIESEDGMWEEFPEFAPIETVALAAEEVPVELPRFDIAVSQVEDFAGVVEQEAEAETEMEPQVQVPMAEDDLLEGPVAIPVLADATSRPASSAGAFGPGETSTEVERVVAEAAREVAWLARRVADGLELATAKIASFDERLDQLEALVAHAQADSAVAASKPLLAMPTNPSDLEEWSMAIARLIRSDSHALREEFHRMSEEQGIAIAELQRLVEFASETARGSVDESLARVDVAVLRLGDSIDARIGSAVASIESTADHLRSEDQRSLMNAIDDRMEALARLVRSDNERLAAQLETEIEIGKQVLRSAKELQASLAQDVAIALDRRAIRGTETSAR